MIKNLIELVMVGDITTDILKNIEKKKIITIGLAYSFQKVINIPINDYDIKLDYIITDKKY